MYDKCLHTTNKLTVTEVIVVQFIIFVVCAENYYQTSTANDPLLCAACPTGSTTQGATNSQDISACGKYSKIMIIILRY